MTRIEQCVRTVRIRQQSQWFWSCVSLGSLISGSLACGAALLRIPFGSDISWQYIGGLLLVGPIVGATYALVYRRSLEHAARTIDRAANLKDRTRTALGFLESTNVDELKRLQLEDAENHLNKINPVEIVPTRYPRSFVYAGGLALLSIAIIALTLPPEQVIASSTTNSTIVGIADQLQTHLDELKQMQELSNIEELDKLLKDLAVQIETLRLPGMDPKEAMAKLSEMESALRQMQQQVAQPLAEAELQKVGEAMSLSESMASAGGALSKGDLEKAAEELAKLEMPKLDLKTEKAITEKLDALNQNDASGNKKKSQVQEAASQLSQSLGQGDKSKFKDSIQGLASEAQKQGQRKKLTDLLRKQCQCLGECKSQCESECKSESESNKKGGTKAGLARSGNEPGDKTVRLKASPKLDIKGQDSGQGASDIETEEAPSQDQEAVRNYQQKHEQYEAMSESVLNSDSIPLGQRQTIRKYFESIRPSNAETDQVVEQSK